MLPFSQTQDPVSTFSGEGLSREGKAGYRQTGMSLVAEEAVTAKGAKRLREEG